MRYVTAPYGSKSGSHCCPKSAAEVLNMLPADKPIKYVLDVGAGSGEHAWKMAERGWYVNMCDIAPNLPDVERQDMHGFSYQNHSFDLIFCSQVLEHALAPYIALCEFNRVLKPEGLLALTMPDACETWVKDSQHYSCFNLMQWTHLINKAGFDVISSKEHFENGDSPENKMLLFVCKKREEKWF